MSPKHSRGTNRSTAPTMNLSGHVSTPDPQPTGDGEVNVETFDVEAEVNRLQEIKNRGA